MWKPRDVLLRMLRDIDSGEVVDIESLIVVYKRKTHGVSYMVSSKNHIETLGILTRAVQIAGEDI